MPDLGITVASVEVVPYAASPVLAFKLRVTNRDAAEAIHTVVLRAQIQIEVAKRRYTAEEQAGLGDLFGTPDRWGQTLKPLLWTNASVVVPQFTGETTIDLQVPCTFDFSVATTKYFNALDDGEIPVLLMFSGTVFFADEDGDLRVAPISWEKETKFRVPLKVWKDMMDTYYPNIAWLCLRRDVFEELHQYKVTHGIVSWEQMFERLLAAEKEDSVR